MWTGIKRHLGKMKIARKLIVLISVIAAINIAAGAYVIVTNNRIGGVVRSNQSIVDANRQFSHMANDMNTCLLTMFLALEGTGSIKEEAAKSVETYFVSLSAQLEQLKATFENLDALYPASGSDTLEFSAELSEYVVGFNMLSTAKDQMLKPGAPSADADAVLKQQQENSRLKQNILLSYNASIAKSNAAVTKRFAEISAASEAKLRSDLSFSNKLVIVNAIILALIPFAVIIQFIISINKGMSGIFRRIEAYQGRDFTYEANLDRGDEFGVIDGMLAQMGAILKETIRSTVHVSAQVLDITDKMNALIAENKSASHRVHAHIATGETKIASQYESTASISAVTQQVSASSEEIAASSEHINLDMMRMRDSSQDGKQKLDEVVKAVDEAKDGFASLLATVDVIQGRYEEIAKFLSGIREITAQTNLLSLNASIEAAQAREHGRGFSVIAGEIRKLSGDTEKLANDITGALKQIRQDMEVMGKSFESFGGVLAKSKELSSDCSLSFGDIQKQSDTLSVQVSEINAAIGDIAAGMTHIVETVEALTGSSTDVNAAMHEMKRVSGVQFGVSDQLIELAASLKETSGSLKRQSAAFKI